MDILKFIEELPNLFNWIVPGYLYLMIHYFICSKKTEDYKYLIFKSTAISFLFNTLISTLCGVFKIKLSSNGIFILETLIAVTASYYLSIFYDSVFFNNTLLQWLRIKKTANTNVWKDIFDFDKGMIVKVYISGEKITYQGKLVLIEDKEENPEIVISNYVCRDYDSKLMFDFRKENNRRVALNVKDVSRIEMLYTEDSLKI